MNLLGFRYKPQCYILDTNVFYEYISNLGVVLPGVGTRDRDDIDYEKLFNFLEKSFEQKVVFIPPLVFYEFVNRFRDDKDTLKSILNQINVLRKKYRYDLVCNNIGKIFMFDEKLDLNRWNSYFKKDYRNILLYVDQFKETKLDSEVQLLSYFPIAIIITYFLSAHFNDETYYEAYKITCDTFCEKNFPIILNEIQATIKNEFTEGYLQEKEKYIFRDIFDTIIEKSSSYILYPFDYVFDALSRNEKPTYELSSILKLETNQNVRDKYQLWKKSMTNKLTNINDVLDSFKDDMKKKRYSDSQIQYFIDVVNDFFNQKTKMDSNDAEDFWYLGYVIDNFYLLSFDKQILETLKKSNPKNYASIKEFFK